jgi:hypothetical protein
MNKIWKSIIFTFLLLMGITGACNLPPAPQIDTETPVPTAASTETQIPVSTPTESVPPASATPEFAPFCEASDATTVSAPSQCQMPIAEESSTFCTKKDPYNLILANQGSTFEVLTKGFRCSDAGKKGDRQIITCTGPMTTSFQVSVCDSACIVPTIQAEMTQCPQDYSFNNILGCCTQELQPASQSCTVLELKTISCVINCGGINRESKCKKNSFACEWNDVDKICQLRR